MQKICYNVLNNNIIKYDKIETDQTKTELAYQLIEMDVTLYKEEKKLANKLKSNCRIHNYKK